MKNRNALVVFFTVAFCYCTNPHVGYAQVDSTLFNRASKDTATQIMNMDAVYNRPFLHIEKLPVSLGGYIEANVQHLGTNGESEGSQFQFRRMTLFFGSSVSTRIKFLSELEFEDGTREIDIEFAAMDIEFHPLVNLRGGIIMNPIGAFNQNHDGPKWEFTDRPIAMTQMLPATWSNAGFGLYGKHFANDWMFGYEAYLSGGFDNSITDNELNKTFLPAAKENPERFESSASGTPLMTGKFSVRNNNIGELGISYMGGVYSELQDETALPEPERRCDVLDIDCNTMLPALSTAITAEWAWVFVDVPATYTQIYGKKQRGGFVDIVQPVLKRSFSDWDNATLNVALRVEYVDWNVATFAETGGNIYDDLWSIMPAVSFRPTPQTVIRLNYRYQSQHDIFGNPPIATGGLILGISSYF